MGKRKKWEVKIPTVAKAFVDLEDKELKFFTDKSMTELASNKGGTTLEISVPAEMEEIGILEVRKAMYPPIIALGMNREVWPKAGAHSLSIIMDNRNIGMVNREGKFREDKYRQLCQCCSWKRWAMAIYNYEDGSVRAILWWKK